MSPQRLDQALLPYPDATWSPPDLARTTAIVIPAMVTPNRPTSTTMATSGQASGWSLLQEVMVTGVADTGVMVDTGAVADTGVAVDIGAVAEAGVDPRCPRFPTVTPW
jgi:hypothetical protein